MERLTKIERKLDTNGLPYTADDIIDEFNRYAHEYSLFNFMESIIAKLKQNGKDFRNLQINAKQFQELSVEPIL